VSCWVKLVGASDLPLPNDPFIRIPSLRELIRFPRDQFPRDMARGDELLLYAVGGYKKIFAATRLEEDPRRDVPGADPVIYKRWPHAAAIQLGPHIDYVENGPDLSEINPRLGAEIRQGVSHFSISSADFQIGVRLILRAKEVERRMRRQAAPGSA
jgi:hypothetical protein